MAVAVKTPPETSARQPLNRLGVSSLTGALYVLGSLAVIFYALPALWKSAVSPVLTGNPESPVDIALRVLVMIAAAVGLGILGRRLAGPRPPHGLRAGIFTGVLGIFVAGWIAVAVGGLLQRGLGADSPLGLGLMAVLFVGLLVLTGVLFFRPGFNRGLIAFEDQGWFTAAPYKKSQGLRVRRGTIVGVLVLVVCGVGTLLSRNTLGTSNVREWAITIPFTGGHTLHLLPDIQFTVPLLLTALALWIGYRVVNFPAFADFLIATEAELNKVSWISRKRLIQDTVVVLTTMFFLTFFLFAVDLIWFKILSSPYVQVIQTSQATPEEQAREQDW